MVVKRVLFITGSCGRELWMWKIFQEMNKKEEIVPHFIATREKNIDYLLSQGIPKENITAIIPFQNSTHTVNKEYIQECEKKYGLHIWDAWSVSSVRKKSRAKMAKEEIYGLFQSAFEGIEKVVKDKKVEYCISYGPSGYHAMVFYAVLKKNNVRIMELVASMIPYKFTFAEDLSNIWPSLVKSYQEIQKHGLTKKEREEAEKFIFDFQNKPKVPDCNKKYKEPLQQKVKKYSHYTYQLLRYRKLPPDLRFIFWPIIQKTYDYAGIFEKPQQGEKYVFFPLHYQPESTTLIYGKWYVDQLSLIENISKSIPMTHLLYVKEHPFGYGNRNPSFYRRLKKIPNLRLLSPHEDVFEIIKKCSLLITITGTGGWEALLFQIPPLTFGNIFYNVSEETTKVKKIEELPEIIKQKLDQKINKEKLVQFVAAMFRCSYDGLARLPSDCNDHSLADENVQLLVKGIYDYMPKDKSKTPQRAVGYTHQQLKPTVE